MRDLFSTESALIRVGVVMLVILVCHATFTLLLRMYKNHTCLSNIHTLFLTNHISSPPINNVYQIFKPSYLELHILSTNQ